MNVAVAGVLLYRPELVYTGPIAQSVHKFSGLVRRAVLWASSRMTRATQRLSDASLAPGFHHACALLSLSVGCGMLYGARSTSVEVLSAFGALSADDVRESAVERGPAVLMNAVWAVSILATCFARPELGSSTLLFSGVQDLLVTALCFFVAGGPLLQVYGVVAKKGKVPSKQR